MFWCTRISVFFIIILFMLRYFEYTNVPPKSDTTMPHMLRYVVRDKLYLIVQILKIQYIRHFGSVSVVHIIGKTGIRSGYAIEGWLHYLKLEQLEWFKNEWNNSRNGILWKPKVTQNYPLLLLLHNSADFDVWFFECPWKIFAILLLMSCGYPVEIVRQWWNGGRLGRNGEVS